MQHILGNIAMASGINIIDNSCIEPNIWKESLVVYGSMLPLQVQQLL